MCTRCLTAKPETEYYVKNVKRPELLQARCKTCYKELVRPTNRTNTRNNRYKITALMFEHFCANPCVDCGIDDPLVLQFDHRPNEIKLYDVSRMKRACMPIDRIREEIAKCDVRCANCHQRKTTLLSRAVQDSLSSPM